MDSAQSSQVDVSQGNIDLEVAPMLPREDPPRPEVPQQSSNILSLTLGELQLKSGRSLGSMNMDDFIASIWSVDEAASSILPSSENDPPEDQPEAATETGLDGALLRQNSFLIPSLLCKKTVDEVWSEIQIKCQKDKQVQNDSKTGIPEDHDQDEPMMPQPLGETTLEDFLEKTGVAQGRAMPSSSRPNSFAPTHLKPGLELLANGHNRSNIPGVSMNYPMILGNYCNSCTGESSPNIFNEKTLERLGLKRRISGQVELMGDRRHRRMIKNRESAARSRARKQAYTAELEVELNQLREENEKLKGIMAEIDDLQKELSRKRNRNGPGKLANRLKFIRRTVSMEW